MIALLALATLGAAESLEAWDAAGQAVLRKPARSMAMHVDGLLWIDAEDFADYGGWELDTQFVHLVGSGYLIAPGVGEPVDDALVMFHMNAAGTYHVWVRARDWLPEFHPGRFEVLVNGEALPTELGRADVDDWRWTRAGAAPLRAGMNSLALHDLTGAYARCDALVLARDPDYAPPSGVAAIEEERARLTGLSLDAQHRGDFDVVVVGGGPSGCPAAIAAARLGAKTALIQDRPVLGGNASLELGVPMNGAAGFLPHARETGIVEEAARLRIHGKHHSASIPFQQLAEAEPGLTLFLNSRVVGVSKDGPVRIKTLKAVDTLTGGYSTVGARYVIDCTGDGWAGFYAGAEYRVGREPKSLYGEPDAPAEPDAITMSGCLMGRHSLSYRAVDAGAPAPYEPPPWAAKLPDLAALARRPRNLATGEWWLEHGGHWDDLYDAERSRDELIRISFGYWDYLKNRWPDRAQLRNYTLMYVPFLVAKRESRRLIGDYVLTAHDTLSGTIFPDAVSYGGWPVDIHNPEGIYEGMGPYHTNYRIPTPYTIPFRCLYSKNIENLLFAGRCASVSHFALGTIRVERTLATLGQAAGTGAALCLRHGMTPRELATRHADLLQQTLLKFDQHIPEVRNEDPADLARTARTAASSVAKGLYFRCEEAALRDLWHDMDHHRRAQSVPLAHGRAGRARLYLKSLRDDPVTLALHLCEAASGDDFSAAEDAAVAEAELPAGHEGWLEFAFDRDVTTRYVFVWLGPVEGVQWRLMNSGLKGMRRAYGVAGARGDEAWVRPGGVYACCFDPPAASPCDCRPANVVNGAARPTRDAVNLWTPDPGAPLPQWVEVRFPKPTLFNTVHVAFVTDLDARRFDAVYALDTVQAYRLLVPDGAGWREIYREDDNFQRWRRIRVEPVMADAVRLEVLAARGPAPPGVYEIRVYNDSASE